MTLDELIEALEAEPADKVMKVGLTEPHSWRGDYIEVAFEPSPPMTVGEVLPIVKSAVGTTYQGWKGGDYTMKEYTAVHLDYQGESMGGLLGPILLALILGNEPQIR